MINTLFLTLWLSNLLLALANIGPLPLVSFFQILWRTVNSKPPTIPFGVVACTFSENLSRNRCVRISLLFSSFLASTVHSYLQFLYLLPYKTPTSPDSRNLVTIITLELKCPLNIRYSWLVICCGPWTVQETPPSPCTTVTNVLGTVRSQAICLLSHARFGHCMLWNSR